jgi:hypothetical protein
MRVECCTMLTKSKNEERMRKEGRIAKYVLKLSSKAHFRPSTTNMAVLVLKLSPQAQIRP